MSKTDHQEIKSIAREINLLFVQARKEIDVLKIVTKKLFENPKKTAGLLKNNRYEYTKDYVYYTPEDDGYCEMWASGYMPVGVLEKKRIKLFEHLCPDFKSVYNNNNFIDNVYLTTYDSIVIGYPYTDMHVYLESGLDLTQAWVTYRAAAEQANPEKKTFWVKPYIDAIGRGYMTSIITPVYHNDFLEATLGIDITVDLISDKFISLSKKNLMIVTQRTIPVAMNKNSFKVLRIKGLEKYNYLKKEPENRAISPSLMMINSKTADIRSIAKWIQSPEKEITLPVNGRQFIFFKEEIPEIRWFLIEIKPT